MFCLWSISATVQVKGGFRITLCLHITGYPPRSALPLLYCTLILNMMDTATVTSSQLVSKSGAELDPQSAGVCVIGACFNHTVCKEFCFGTVNDCNKVDKHLFFCKNRNGLHMGTTPHNNHHSYSVTVTVIDSYVCSENVMHCMLPGDVEAMLNNVLTCFII